MEAASRSSLSTHTDPPRRQASRVEVELKCLLLRRRSKQQRGSSSSRRAAQIHGPIRQEGKEAGTAGAHSSFVSHQQQRRLSLLTSKQRRDLWCQQPSTPRRSINVTAAETLMQESLALTNDGYYVTSTYTGYYCAAA